MLVLWAAAQVVESPIASPVAFLSLLGWSVFALATPVTALDIYRHRARPRAWLILVISAWLSFVAAFYFAPQLYREFSIFALFLMAAAVVGTILVSVLAYRAAWRLPSFPLAVTVAVAVIATPLLTWAVSLDPLFDQLWLTLNAGRMAHFREYVQTSVPRPFALGREIQLPDELGNLTRTGSFVIIGECEGRPVLYLPQFYPFIGGDWSRGYVSIPCSRPAIREGWNDDYNVDIDGPAIGDWWSATY